VKEGTEKAFSSSLSTDMNTDTTSYTQGFVLDSNLPFRLTLEYVSLLKRSEFLSLKFKVKATGGMEQRYPGNTVELYPSLGFELQALATLTF